MKQLFLPLFLCLCFIGLSTILCARPWFSVREVMIEGEAENLDQRQVKNLLSPWVSRNFFSININKIQSVLQDFSQVDAVTIEKIWPDRLFIDVTLQQPVVAWSQKNTYLNPYGEFFYSPNETGDFPVFSGSTDNATKMLAWYQQMNTMLQFLGRKISQLSINPMNEWSIVLDNGTQVIIGHEKVLEKMARFVNMYPKIVPERTKQIPKTVDLRYENGMSIQWGAK